MTVVDAAGHPAVAANVQCCASPPFGEVEGGDDVVTGTTDQRGQAVIKLLPGRSYSCFATTALLSGHTFTASVVDELAAGGDCALHLGSPQPGLRVVLEDTGPWQDTGPLSVQVAPSGSHLLVGAVDGEAPPLPQIGSVRVLDAKGQVLWSTTIYPGYHLLDRTTNLLTVKVPPPQTLPVRVSDAGGVPLAGVELWQGTPAWGSEVQGFLRPLPKTNTEWRRAAVTGADGCAGVRLACDVAAGGKVGGYLLVQARMAGRVLGEGGVSPFGPFSGLEGRGIAVPKDQVLPIELETVQPLQVTPPGVCDVLVVGEVTVRVQTDTNGKASLPLPRKTGTLRNARVIGADGQQTWTVVQQAADGCSIDRAARTIRLHVRDERGGPARGARAAVAVFDPARHSVGADLPVPLDRAGNAQFGLGAGQWFVLAAAGQDAAWRQIDAAAGATELTLVTRPFAQATVRFVDKDDKPLPGLTVTCSPSLQWQSNNPSPESLMLFSRQFTTLPHGARTTDADGGVGFPILPLPAALLRVAGTFADGTFWSAEVEPGQSRAIRH